jgi:hypothetical protein
VAHNVGPSSSWSLFPEPFPKPRPQGFTSCSFTVTEHPAGTQEELEAPHQLC